VKENSPLTDEFLKQLENNGKEEKKALKAFLVGTCFLAEFSVLPFT
jgi:hypothetical protein